MLYKKYIFLFFLITLSACATWSTSSVDSKSDAIVQGKPKQPSQILISEQDINRPYKVLGDIEVVVRKTTIFNEDPTPAMVDQKLQEKAAELGADAVVLVRYGTLGIGFWSWGTLEGKGRAVIFK